MYETSRKPVEEHRSFAGRLLGLLVGSPGAQLETAHVSNQEGRLRIRVRLHSEVGYAGARPIVNLSRWFVESGDSTDVALPSHSRLGVIVPFDYSGSRPLGFLAQEG